MAKLTQDRITAFRRRLLRFYKAHGRKLPFRETTDPYKVAVAEVMLQQTQVERVLPKYEDWIRRWPTWQALARATERQLITAWTGLGYNRRCLFLGRLARTVVDEFNGILPDDPKTLAKLPGLGPYTSRAILIFAFNKPLVTVDTNIRRVFLHEFGLQVGSSRQAIEDLAWQLLPRHRSRDWHNALMDYSVLRLPRRLANVPPVSRQSRFEGSLRQIRGEIIRRLTSQHRLTVAALSREIGREKADVLAAARALEKDGMVTLKETRIRLAESSRH